MLAAANRDDPDRLACQEILSSSLPPLFVVAPVLGEAFYLIGKYLGPGAEAELAISLAQERYQLMVPTENDLHRVAELIIRYADLGLGGTDACIVALAERLGIADIATLDRRHFSVVRPDHVAGLRLLPDDLAV